MQPNTCTRRPLAIGDFALVERCGCGAVHVTIGAVTLRLAASTIGPLAETLTEAARALTLEQSLTIHAAAEVLS